MSVYSAGMVPEYITLPDVISRVANQNTAPNATTIFESSGLTAKAFISVMPLVLVI